ncbi:MAG: hypothetical protein ACKOE8_09430 [Opitutaceae bacterium]
MSRHTISARLLIFAASLLFSGCESLSDAAGSVRDRIAAREETRERTYAAAPRATYDALKSAATQMGYRQTRGGPAQGEFDAVSAVAPGERHGSARQILMKARVTAGLDGKSAVVGVSLTEVIEDDSSNRPGLATRTALRDTPQYQVLFQRISDLLGVPAQTPGR